MTISDFEDKQTVHDTSFFKRYYRVSNAAIKFFKHFLGPQVRYLDKKQIPISMGFSTGTKGEKVVLFGFRTGFRFGFR